MRYIAIRQLTLDPGWLDRATTAEEAVRKAAPEERSKVINAHQDVWKDLKEALRLLSYEKCWYCESIDPRSDNAVDHYRPKGNVKAAKPPHDGYWWLAFNWMNYRFSCTYCNSIRSSGGVSGGKQDYFPLWDEEKRARTQDEIEYELPLLLDPTKATDVRLIAFSEDGSVGPALDEAHEFEYRMADETIKRYHLKHQLLVEFRAARLKEVRGWVENADKYLARYTRNRQPPDRVTANEFLDLVTTAVSPRAPYSTAVKHLLAGMAPSSEASRTVLNIL
jgi:uncharacterized protein (TIGR02646 family)